jgi:transcriptional regulator with XRE-family HTH domain
MSVFSKNLRYLRKKGNYNQDEISDLFNKRANTIGNWENEKSEPSLTELMTLGDFFKVDTGDLLHLDMEKASETDSVNHSDSMNSMESTRTRGKLPGQNQAFPPSSNEGSDAIWFILRELRTVNEKLDMLISAGTTGFKKNSDKSDH